MSVPTAHINNDSNASSTVKFLEKRGVVSAANKTLTECFRSTKGESIFKSSISSNDQCKVKNDFLLALKAFGCLNEEIYNNDSTVLDTRLSACFHHCTKPKTKMKQTMV